MRGWTLGIAAFLLVTTLATRMGVATATIVDSSLRFVGRALPGTAPSAAWGLLGFVVGGALALRMAGGRWRMPRLKAYGLVLPIVVIASIVTATGSWEAARDHFPGPVRRYLADEQWTAWTTRGGVVARNEPTLRSRPFAAPMAPHQEVVVVASQGKWRGLAAERAGRYTATAWVQAEYISPSEPPSDAVRRPEDVTSQGPASGSFGGKNSIPVARDVEPPKPLTRDAREVAILSVRHGEGGEGATAELLPVVLCLSGRFEEVGSYDEMTQEDCTSLRFAGMRSPGIDYIIYHRGLPVGSATSLTPTHGRYACSELCVVMADLAMAPVNPDLAAWPWGRDEAGTESGGATSYIALSAEPQEVVFSALPADTLDTATREAITRYAWFGLLGRAGGTTDEATIDVAPPQVFVSRPSGELHAFVAATQEGPGDFRRSLGAIVGIEADGELRTYFKSVDDDNRGGYGLESYRFFDALDIDGDGRSEVIAVMHLWENNIFCILRFDGARYEIVHRGPSYGC
jgi:hypothetical protein